MKKTYAKPVLIAESFLMVEHIASGCIGAYSQVGNTHIHHNGSSCQYVDMDGSTYFTLNTNACEDVLPVDPGFPMEGLFECYQGPAGGSATPFAS